MKVLKAGYISGVNLARFMGALGIIIYHNTCHNSVLAPIVPSVQNEGFRVISIIFFIISGACLARTYASELDLKSYFIRRWKAIYPLFFICYLFFFVEHTVSYGAWWTGIPSYRFIYTLLGVDGYLSAYQRNFYLIGEWFLGALVLCYIFFPFLRWLVKHIPFTTAAVLLVGTYFIPYLPLFERDPLQNIWSCVTIFYLGILIAQSRFLLQSRDALWISTFLLIILLFVKIPYFDRTRLLGPIFTSIVAFVSLVNIGTLCERRHLLRSLINKLGKLTYPVFLVQHIVIVRVMIHWSGESFAAGLGGILISVIISIMLAWSLTLIADRVSSFITRKKPVSS